MSAPERHYCVLLLSTAEVTWLAERVLADYTSSTVYGGDGTVYATTQDNDRPARERQRADLHHICTQLNEAEAFMKRADRARKRLADGGDA